MGLYSLTLIAKEYSLTRDAYYKFLKRFNQRQTMEEKVIKIVSNRRKILPREGVRKLHKALEVDFKTSGVKVGRDTLFQILRKHHMLVYRKKYSSRTTNSYHHFYKYSNLINEMEITRPNQVWVSDITYIRTLGGFCYLAIITDLYSRKIIGYDLSDSLELNGCLRALQQALRTLPKKQRKNIVHHSDRGVQYCSHAYVNQLINNGMAISMTQENHCYENAVAERINGILKGEFYLDQCFSNLKLARKATKNAIKMYNSKRLHLSLNYKTPNQVYKIAA